MTGSGKGIWDWMLDGISAMIRRTVGRTRAAILVYHRITPRLFESHLERLRQLYNIIPLDQLVEAIERRDWSSMPPRSLVVTFDDGWCGFAELLAIIQRHKLPVTQFLISGVIGSNRHLWASEVPTAVVRELKGLPNTARLRWLREVVGYEPAREYAEREMLTYEEIACLARTGVQFGAHTVTHPELPMCEDELAWKEILQSKLQLEDSLDLKVEHFAYPSGNFTSRDVALVRQAGFRSARTMRRGWNGRRADPYRLRDLGPGDDLKPSQIGHLEVLSLGRRIRKLIDTSRGRFSLRRQMPPPFACAKVSRISTTAKPSICFVAHDSYGALAGLAGGRLGHIGGVQRQTSLMAKWFAGRGYRVSMLTWDEGQPDGEAIDGVRVLRICREDEGLPGVRYFHPRWTGLVRAMRRADAGVYYQNAAGCETGQISAWCRKKNRKFVFSAASDRNCDPRLMKPKPIRERLLYRYGVHLAHRVVVQTQKQRHMLRDGYGLDSVVLPMPCPGPSDVDYEQPDLDRAGSRHILWIGRICRDKRPDRLLDLADRCPDLRFDLVGPANGSEYARRVYEQAKRSPNIAVHGPVSRDRIAGFYTNSCCLCCTSEVEGFPNTFLEAWSHGLPVVSTFDPDDVIAARGLGSVGADTPDLAVGIRRLLESPDRWREASGNARRYYEENHTVEVAMQRFRVLFLQVATS